MSDAKLLSPTIITHDVAATRAFYETNFEARPSFDCGWYVQLRLNDGVEICVMAPQGDSPTFAGGVMFNIQFDDVDAIHKSLCDREVSITIPLEDHPWGDRGFAVTDPAGAIIYCYSPIAPAAEFAHYFI